MRKKIKEKWQYLLTAAILLIIGISCLVHHFRHPDQNKIVQLISSETYRCVDSSQVTMNYCDIYDDEYTPAILVTVKKDRKVDVAQGGHGDYLMNTTAINYSQIKVGATYAIQKVWVGVTIYPVPQWRIDDRRVYVVNMEEFHHWDDLFARSSSLRIAFSPAWD